MPLFLARQRRPYWVCFVQEIEADSAEEAEDKFYNEFSPDLTVVEGQVHRVNHGPLTIFRKAEFAAKIDCVEAE